jgi:dTDP-4-dehydrorhamnose reductase
MKIALIGADGQLGTDIYKYFTDCGLSIIPLTENEIDVCDSKICSNVLLQLKPEIIINTAAFNMVDACEEETSKAFAVNSVGVKNVAEICVKTGSILIHFSTDFVFGGYDKREPYTEDDCPAPISAYGLSKLAGEYVIRYMLDKYYICRLCGLYGHAASISKGYNFVELMLKLAKEGRSLKVVDDQILTPTSTMDVTKKLYELIRIDRFGLYHITNTGQCSWYDFACEIFVQAGLDPDISAVSTAAFGAKAKRPGYSVLDNKRLRDAGLDDMRHWKEALADYIKERKDLERQ